MAKLKLAAIGVRHGHCWGMIEGLLATKKVELAAVAEDLPRLRKLARERLGGVQMFSDWRKCLREVEPDVVVLTTINVEKQKVVCECFRRGIGVFADKPVFTQRSWLEKAETLWRKAKRKPALSALLGLRSGGASFALKRMVDRGELGEIVHVYKCRPHRLRPEGRMSWELNNVQNGGPLIDLASHDVDYAMWLIGSKPVEVTATAKLSRFRKLKGFADNAQMTVRFAGGAVLMVEADWLTPEKSRFHGDCRALVTGTEGFAEILEHKSALTVTTFKRPERKVTPLKRTFNLYTDFLAQREGKAKWLKVQEIFALHRVLMAADESARKGGRIVKL